MKAKNPKLTVEERKALKETSLRKRLEDLESKAKTAYQIHVLVENNLHHTVDLKDYKWIALDDVKKLLGEEK